jgi:hypothetical protein
VKNKYFQKEKNTVSCPKKFLARIIKEQDTMKACDLLKSLRKTLHSEKFQNRHKTNITDF